MRSSGDMGSRNTEAFGAVAHLFHVLFEIVFAVVAGAAVADVELLSGTGHVHCSHVSTERSFQRERRHAVRTQELFVAIYEYRFNLGQFLHLKYRKIRPRHAQDATLCVRCSGKETEVKILVWSSEFVRLVDALQIKFTITLTLSIRLHSVNLLPVRKLIIRNVKTFHFLWFNSIL